MKVKLYQICTKAKPITTALQTCTLQAGALNHNDSSEAARRRQTFAREGRAQLWPVRLITQCSAVVYFSDSKYLKFDFYSNFDYLFYLKY
jgi:hypothetical protein